MRNMAELTNTTAYYELLGIEKSAQTSQDDIKRAWRKAALRLHPDRNPDGTLRSPLSFRRVFARCVMEKLHAAGARGGEGFMQMPSDYHCRISRVVYMKNIG